MPVIATRVWRCGVGAAGCFRIATGIHTGGKRSRRGLFTTDNITMISPITLAPIATSPWPVKPVAWYSASSVYNAVNSNKVTTNGTGASRTLTLEDMQLLLVPQRVFCCCMILRRRDGLGCVRIVVTGNWPKPAACSATQAWASAGLTSHAHGLSER